jgi:hypothetical protein
LNITRRGVELVVHGARRQARGAQLVDEVLHVSTVNIGDAQVPHHRADVVLGGVAVVADRRGAVATPGAVQHAAVLDPLEQLVERVRDRDRRRHALVCRGPVGERREHVAPPLCRGALARERPPDQLPIAGSVTCAR